MKAFLTTTAAVLAWSSIALAGTPLEAHQKRLTRYAHASLAKTPRTLCVCRSENALHGAVGHLVQITQLVSNATQVHVQCAVPRFDTAGAIQTHGTCVAFDTLAK